MLSFVHSYIRVSSYLLYKFVKLRIKWQCAMFTKRQKRNDGNRHSLYFPCIAIHCNYIMVYIFYQLVIINNIPFEFCAFFTNSSRANFLTEYTIYRIHSTTQVILITTSICVTKTLFPVESNIFMYISSNYSMYN